MTGLAALQFFLAFIFCGHLFMALQTIAVSRSFDGIELQLALHFAAEHVRVMAALALADLLSFLIGYLLAVFHAMMAFAAL